MDDRNIQVTGRDTASLLARWEDFRHAAKLPFPDPRVAQEWMAFAASLDENELVRLAVARRQRAKRLAKLG